MRQLRHEFLVSGERIIMIGSDPLRKGFDGLRHLGHEFLVSHLYASCRFLRVDDIGRIEVGKALSQF
jgi:hypothetical protein